MDAAARARIDLVALAVLNDLERVLLPLVAAAVPDPETELLVMRGIKNCAAAVCCVLATGLMRALFRGGNYCAWRLTRSARRR